MRRAALLAVAALSVGLADCAGTGRPCPPGQERLRTAQLFFGRRVSNQPGVLEAAFRRFVSQELTPRFPDGLTVLEGGGQWKGEENRLIRESARVVQIILPRTPDAEQRLEAARQAYRARFRQDSILVITRPTCVSF